MADIQSAPEAATPAPRASSSNKLLVLFFIAIGLIVVGTVIGVVLIISQKSAQPDTRPIVSADTDAQGLAYTLNTNADTCHVTGAAFTGTELTIPATSPSGIPVTNIGDNAFKKNITLQRVIVSENITTINLYAFLDCSELTEITLPASITKLSYGTFKNCTKLTAIHYNGTKEQWLSIAKNLNWNESTGEYTVHCTDGDISKPES